ncbi:MAG: hypothetical protein MUF45_12785 [Spirosomaceae bacterium]|nr:hypothetical protein [Spirosomataceae bacterium]
MLLLIKYFFMFLSFWYSQEGKIHDFHTSLTEVHYNAKEKSLEISIRMFTDDLENALTKLNNGQKVMINGVNDKANPFVERYIQQHFAIITPQKQKKTFNFIGKELEGDATWVYIEIPNCTSVNDHTLQNDIMLELFDDQTNLVNFFWGNSKKTFLFNSRIKSAALNF